MIIKSFDMSVDYAELSSNQPNETAKLTSYILEPELVSKTLWNKRPAIIVCAGGGYRSRSSREAETIVLKYCAAGFHGFLLDYSIESTGWPAPTCELSKAVKTVRAIADEYFIDPDKIFVCGFSAGGHLAASLGVYWDLPMIQKGSEATGEENKPNGLILCYPVIIEDDGKTHDGTKQRFTEGKPEKLEYFGLDKRVTSNTPKSFIWHTFEDSSVPVYSSMRFASALLEHGVEYELHIYPKGKHGLSLGNKLTGCEEKHFVPGVTGWMELSINWINSQL